MLFLEGLLANHAVEISLSAAQIRLHVLSLHFNLYATLLALFHAALLCSTEPYQLSGYYCANAIMFKLRSTVNQYG